MARTRTLAQLREGALLVADMPNTSFATSAELNYRVNLAIAELWELIAKHGGEDYLKEPRTLTTTANQAYTTIGATGSSINSLAGSFLRLVSLEVTLDGQSVEIEELPDWNLRHAYAQVTGWNLGQRPYYKLENSSNGAQLRWFPTPVSAHTVTAYIIPSGPVLSSDSDTFDGINGWEEYVMNDVACYLLGREQSDVSFAMAERDRAWQRIVGFIGRKHASPSRVRDVRRAVMNFGQRGRTGWGW